MYAKKVLKKLVEFKTVSAEPDFKEFEEASNFIAGELEKTGFCSEIFSKNGFPSVLAFSQGYEEAKEKIVFISHYDVVPAGAGWETEPFEGVEKDGKIFARGASDAKGGIAAFLSALKEIERKECGIAFFCFADEEIGGKNGIRALLREREELFQKGSVFYILDCSTNGVEIGASGNLSGKITLHGKAGHSAYPFRCTNALEKGILLCSKLIEFGKEEANHVSKIAKVCDNPVNKYMWNRFSITIFRSGIKSNIIPGYAEICFNWRFIPEEDPMERKKDLENILGQVCKGLGVEFSVEFFEYFPGYCISEENSWVKRLKSCVENVMGKEVECLTTLGATDGNVIYTKTKKPTIGFGPIDEDANIHAANEFIRVSTLQVVEEVIRRFIQGYV